MFKCIDVALELAGQRLLSNINITFEPNKISAILGANGAGKSSLLKVLLNEHTCSKGEVEFDNKTLNRFSLAALAEKRAYVAQHQRLGFSLAVFEYLVLARQHINEPDAVSSCIVAKGTEDFSITHLLAKDINALSGGELQLVEFTRAYIQLFDNNKSNGKPLSNKCLLLDEPASALDIKQTQHLYQYLHQFKLLGGTVILIDHDINAMAGVADNLILLKLGEVIDSGKVSDVFTESNLNACFDVSGQLIDSPTSSSKNTQRAQQHATNKSSLIEASEPVAHSAIFHTQLFN